MKHLKPVSKAQSTIDVGTVISAVAALLTALAPIITLIVNASKSQDV